MTDMQRRVVCGEEALAGIITLEARLTEEEGVRGEVLSTLVEGMAADLGGCMHNVAVKVGEQALE